MLTIENLSVIYPDKTKAIDHLTLNIQNGENVALIGANGAGKTSLLLALVGILESAAGKIDVAGITLNKKTLNEIRCLIGMVFQNPDDQLFMPSIYDDIAFGPHNIGLSEADIKIRVDDAIRQLNIEHLRERSPMKLSGGEKRSAAIATVLAMKPSVMLFDEPTAFLDPKARRTLIQLLKELPHTKLLATHDLHFAAEACERIIVINKGSIMADDTPKAILYNQRLMDDCGLEAID